VDRARGLLRQRQSPALIQRSTNSVVYHSDTGNSNGLSPAACNTGVRSAARAASSPRMIFSWIVFALYLFPVELCLRG
jgi:hypothetical protein